MELPISLSNNPSPNPENHVNLEEGSAVPVSSQDNGEVKEKVKKPTRQWAAWTHQEEESFFSALRQVGKNFEKITSRVQSKNKDQVRHYYYRLVRRMNKVLGPGLHLDAKNCKETNAAMLRWWSLLEKYSCKASKLHLKPRRFKLFAEALESQLLKDRKKNVRRRASQGENCPIISATSASNQSRVCGPESRAIKAVLVDNQNIQKFGTTKGPSLNRNLSLGINRGNTKARTSALKTTKYQPKAGIATKAAFKRWEKAAMAAGISLVALAAEQVERSSTDKEVEHHVQDIPAQNGFEYCTKDVPSTMDIIHSSGKLKLQLFPYDEATRRALESDSHNPHLELTLSTRKKISSVVEHLHRKWGHSSIACGELMLLPYFVQPVNLDDCHKWTKDSTLSAADVYSHIGKPPVFRLRYVWFSKASLSCETEKDVDASVPNEQVLDATPRSIPQPCQGSQQLFNTSEDLLSGHEIIKVTSPTAMPKETPISASTSPENINIAKLTEHTSTFMLDNREMITCTIVEDQIQDDLRRDEAALATEEWPDSPTNISVGDLLLELPHRSELDCIESAGPGNFQCLQQISQSCDSFDAAIAAHILKQQKMSTAQPTIMSHTSSIWDAEDTCDAFSFQKFGKSSPETSGGIAKTNAGESDGAEEPNPKELLTNNPMQDADLVDNCQPYQLTFDNSAKDFNGLTDIYWPDSLGALDLDIPSCRYRSDDMILSDSLGGLNRLIASSLDAFQNCSFFGTDKKESAAAAEAGEFTSDLKISAEV